MRDEHLLTNEDLRAANEELQSLNEEYRSTTEELETSKEELQSINEELQTVNQELKLKLEEVSHAHGDLENLIAAAGVPILFLDASLRIKRFTPQLGQIFNIKTRDLDRPISDLTHTLRYDEMERDARHVIASRTTAERTVTSADGRVFIVRVRPYATAGPASDGAVLTFVDVSAITRAEESLRSSEQRLAEELHVTRRLHELTLSAATAPTMAAALNYVVAAAVELQAGQRAIVELIDQPTNNLEVVAQQGFTADTLPIATAIDAREHSACRRARRSGAAIELPDVLDDASYRAWQGDVETAGYRATQCTPLVSRNDRLVGFLSTYFEEPHAFSERDRQISAMIGRQAADLIESRQQHEALARQAQALAAQDRDRETFIAALGHELRNPLAAITGSLPMLSATDDRSRRAIDVLQRQTAQMTRLVGDLLDINRDKYGKLRLARVPVVLNDSVAAAIDTIRPQAEAKRLDLRLDLPADRVTVEADPNRLTQVLDNLLRNAIMNTSRGGVTVTVRREGSHARVGVRDTGAGIDASDVPALFKPFEQRLGDAGAGGCGLGLALVKALVEAHKGTVSVQSHGRGTGSEFSFTIPLSADVAGADDKP